MACATFGVLASAQAASLDEIKETSHIRIGYANETPFAFTETDGRVTGESPEIAKVIFEKMGIKQVDGVLTEWGSLIPGLRAGRFDVPAQYALVLVVARRQPQGLDAVGDGRGIAVMRDVRDDLFHACLLVMPTAAPGSPG